MTQEDHDRFEKEVDAYERDLRTFIEHWIEFIERRRLIVALQAQLDNDGGAPAENAQVRLSFPDPCRRDEPPEKPKRPERPRFEPRRNRGYSPYLSVPRIDLLTPRIEPPNINGPFYEDGSLTVRFVYNAIPHHDPIKTDWFFVGVPEPGAFDVEWRVGAKNLVAPETGSLRLELRHEPAEAGPITTLAGLVNLART